MVHQSRGNTRGTKWLGRCENLIEQDGLLELNAEPNYVRL